MSRFTTIDSHAAAFDALLISLAFRHIVSAARAPLRHAYFSRFFASPAAFSDLFGAGYFSLAAR